MLDSIYLATCSSSAREKLYLSSKTIYYSIPAIEPQKSLPQIWMVYLLVLKDVLMGANWTVTGIFNLLLNAHLVEHTKKLQRKNIVYYLAAKNVYHNLIVV